METVVKGMSEGFDWFGQLVAWIAGGANWVLLVAAAVAVVVMVGTLLITSPSRFGTADPSARPSDGLILTGELMGLVAILGGIVLAFRDTASPWQPVVAIVGGAVLLLLMLAYHRGSDLRKTALAWLAWMGLAIGSAVAVILAIMQRTDSSIPYLLLLGVVLVIGRYWIFLGWPEVRFDPSTVKSVKAESSTDNSLVVQNLRMVYELPDGGEVEALSDVTFTLQPGRLLTLLGPSGCGKTTLLNILAGFLAHTSGEVQLGSTPITGPGQDRGMVFQQGALFEWLTVNDNVGFGARMNGRSRPASREAVQDLLQIVGLQDFGEKAVYELSGGMQQRVALARCLANDPEIILMDEPLGALDALTREKMQGLVLRLWSETGKTIVLVTHSVEEALYLGDQLFVLAPRPGRIERVYDLPFAQQALTADARELKASPEFIRTREEILSLIWEMEEQIMGTGGGH